MLHGRTPGFFNRLRPVPDPAPQHAFAGQARFMAYEEQRFDGKRDAEAERCVSNCRPTVVGREESAYLNANSGKPHQIDISRLHAICIPQANVASHGFLPWKNGAGRVSWLKRFMNSCRVSRRMLWVRVAGY